jgi:hypothetical protein
VAGHIVEIAQAIRTLHRLTFQYDGLSRVVEPYLLGRLRSGREMLRAVQVGGSSRSGTFGSGKLWEVAKMQTVQRLQVAFVPSDPDYSPDDAAFVAIHCRV